MCVPVLTPIRSKSLMLSLYVPCIVCYYKEFEFRPVWYFVPIFIQSYPVLVSLVVKGGGGGGVGGAGLLRKYAYSNI